MSASFWINWTCFESNFEYQFQTINRIRLNRSNVFEAEIEYEKNQGAKVHWKCTEEESFGWATGKIGRKKTRCINEWLRKRVISKCSLIKLTQIECGRNSRCVPNECVDSTGQDDLVVTLFPLGGDSYCEKSNSSNVITRRVDAVPMNATRECFVCFFPFANEPTVHRLFSFVQPSVYGSNWQNDRSNISTVIYTPANSIDQWLFVCMCSTRIHPNRVNWSIRTPTHTHTHTFFEPDNVPDHFLFGRNFMDRVLFAFCIIWGRVCEQCKRSRVQYSSDRSPNMWSKCDVCFPASLQFYRTSASSEKDDESPVKLDCHPSRTFSFVSRSPSGRSANNKQKQTKFSINFVRHFSYLFKSRPHLPRYVGRVLHRARIHSHKMTDRSTWARSLSQNTHTHTHLRSQKVPVHSLFSENHLGHILHNHSNSAFNSIGIRKRSIDCEHKRFRLDPMSNRNTKSN